MEFPRFIQSPLSGTFVPIFFLLLPASLVYALTRRYIVHITESLHLVPKFKLHKSEMSKTKKLAIFKRKKIHCLSTQYK